jgi:hypothetical protein
MASNISSRQNEFSKGGARLRTVDVLVVLVGKPPSEALHLDWSPRLRGFLFLGDARAHTAVGIHCPPGRRHHRYATATRKWVEDSGDIAALLAIARHKRFEKTDECEPHLLMITSI